MTEAAHDDGASGTVALGGTPWRGTDVAEAQRVKEVVLRGLAARRQESATALVAAGEVAP